MHTKTDIHNLILQNNEFLFINCEQLNFWFQIVIFIGMCGEFVFLSVHCSVTNRKSKTVRSVWRLRVDDEVFQWTEILFRWVNSSYLLVLECSSWVFIPYPVHLLPPYLLVFRFLPIRLLILLQFSAPFFLFLLLLFFYLLLPPRHSPLNHPFIYLLLLTLLLYFHTVSMCTTCG